MPWQGGRCLTGDTTIVDTLTPSYIAVSTQIAGSAALTVAERKVSKYTGLLAFNLFVPIAIEDRSSGTLLTDVRLLAPAQNPNFTQLLPGLNPLLILHFPALINRYHPKRPQQMTSLPGVSHKCGRRGTTSSY